MGHPWRSTDSWQVVERAEAALGQPLAHLLLDDDADVLGRTREAQLAVLLASLMAWRAAAPSLDAPVAFAGHSLGEITALIASGALGLEEGIRLAGRRAEATQEAADHRPGAMAAFMGATLEQADRACGGGGERECWMANDNAPGQVVVGGTEAGVSAATERARELGVRRVVPLNVAGAFHTPLMAEAADTLRGHLASLRFARPSAPVVCNVDASAYSDDQWAERLATHLISPVRWRSGMETLFELGADTFVEVGPGNVLSGLARRALPEVATLNVSRPDDVPALVGVG